MAFSPGSGRPRLLASGARQALMVVTENDLRSVGRTDGLEFVGTLNRRLFRVDAHLFPIFCFASYPPQGASLAGELVLPHTQIVALVAANVPAAPDRRATRS